MNASKNTNLQVIKPNFFQNGIRYELTVNPDDNHQFYESPLRHVRLSEFMRQFFMTHFDSLSNYHLIPEISEIQHSNKMGPYPRIHYHGVIIFYDVYTFLLFNQYKLSKFSDFQFNLFRPDYWPKYITKQSPIINYQKTKVISNISLKYLIDEKYQNIEGIIQIPSSPILKTRRKLASEDQDERSEEMFLCGGSPPTKRHDSIKRVPFEFPSILDFGIEDLPKELKIKYRKKKISSNIIPNATSD